MFRQGLIQRYGLEYTDSIENLANETRQYKYTKSGVKLQYDLLIKEMKWKRWWNSRIFRNKCKSVRNKLSARNLKS
jgi:hypothetical protein